MQQVNLKRLSNAQIRGVLAMGWFKSGLIYTTLHMIGSLFVEGINDLDDSLDFIISLVGLFGVVMLISLIFVFIPAYFIAKLYENKGWNKLRYYLLTASVLSAVPCLVMGLMRIEVALVVFFTAIISTILIWKSANKVRLL